MRIRLSIRRRLALVAVPLLLTALAGCGGGEEAEPTSSRPTTETTSESPSASAEPGKTEPAADDAGEKVDAEQLAADMVSALDTMTTAHITMSISGAAGLQASGDVDYGGDRPAMAMTMRMDAAGGQEMQMRVVDGVVYMAMPGATPPGKFLKMDLGGRAGDLAGIGDLKEMLDPRSSMQQFSDALTSASLLGTEEIDGEELDHYELEMATRKVKSLRNLPAGAQLPRTIAFDVWLDDDFVTRRMLMELPGGVGTMETAMTDLGDPVSIQAPPPDRVVEMPAR